MKIYRTLTLLILIFSFSVQTLMATARDITIESYIHNLAAPGIWSPVPAPLPFRFVRSVYAQDLGLESLAGISEVAYYNGRLFISVGNRLVITDTELNTASYVEGGYYNGIWHNFTTLDGVFATEYGEIYVAEPSQGRIWHFDSELNVIRILGRPYGLPLAENIPWMPFKVAVDQHGRIYAIANNVFEGIVEINPDGTFNRYFGVVDISYTLADLFWRTIRTQAQRAMTALWLPVNFTNLDIDPSGFVFATLSEGDDRVKMLNARGENIMRRADDAGMFIGDINFNTFGVNIPTGPSIINIVRTTDFGVFFAFDSNRNRLFAYDQDGHLLMAVGGSGQRSGMTSSVTDLIILGDYLIKVDSGSRSLEVFELTSYGHAVFTAARYQYKNNYLAAADAWRTVIAYNPFFQYAHLAIGRALYRHGYFAEALHYFQIGQSVEYFSMAYSRVRAEAIGNSFNTIMIIIFVVAILFVVWRIWHAILVYRKKRGVAT